MSIPTLELIGLLCMCKIITMLVILILLVQNTFLKKLNHLLTIIIIIIKNIITNIFRVQAYSSIMCGYFCIGFIDFMLAGKTLTEYTNLFSPNKFKKNEFILFQV